MTRRNGAGVASIENDARLANVLAGGRDCEQVSPTSKNLQDLAAELIRQTGPRLRRPSWPHFAGSRPARPDAIEDAIRHSSDDSVLAHALRAALSKRGRR